MSDKLWALGAEELARRIRQRDVSCREAMQSCLERLEAVNPRINAVVDWRADEALVEADAADARVCHQLWKWLIMLIFNYLFHTDESSLLPAR